MGIIFEGVIVLVIGGSGFVGSYVVDVFMEYGFKVWVLDCCELFYLWDGQIMFVGDLRDGDFLKKVVFGCEVVFYFVGIVDIGEVNVVLGLIVEVNVFGMVNMMFVCVQVKVWCFVFVSIVYVYFNEGGFYCVSK